MPRLNSDIEITEVTVDGPADPLPTSVVATALAVSVVGPIALLPAAGWWAAKRFSK